MLRWERRWTGLLLLAAAVAISGCARPRDENLTAFAGSTKALATAVTSAGDLNTELDGKIKMADAAAKYASATVGVHPEFPAQTGQFVSGHSDADWQVIQAFLAAVSGYASVLAAVNDPKLESDLTDKATSFATALGKSVNSRDTARKDPKAATRLQQIQTIGGIVVDIVSIASNIYAGYAIQESMAKVQPLLEAAEGPLTVAVDAIIADDKAKLDDYMAAAQRELRVAAGDPSFTAKFNTYVALNQDYRALETRVAALKGLDKAIKAMVTAHGKLMDDLDSKTAMLQFLQTVGDIVSKVDQAEKLRKKL